jgi:CRP/FNR family cyclic AMP-dependent transcriptional regulator
VSPEDLKQFALLTEFSEEEREFLAELLEKRELPNGKSAFREGSEGEGLVLLEAGLLKLKSRRTGGVVGVLEAHEHLGAASLFALGNREITALADGPCTIWTLSRSSLSRLLDDSPRAAFRLAEAVARELVALMRDGLDTLVEKDPG